MNRLTIIGRLTRDPDTKVSKNGLPLCLFTVAVDRQGRDKGQTDFFRCTAFGKTAEACSAYLEKGHLAAVVGHVTCYAYNDAEGKAMANLDVACLEVEFLGGPRRRVESNGPWAGDDVSDDGKFIKVDLGDDLPF